MSRTDLDAETLARSLRAMAGDPYDSDGSVEWVYEPMQASVLLDIADALDESAKLREFIDLKETCWKYVGWCDECPYNGVDDEHDNCSCTLQEKIDSLARELGIEVN